MAAGRKPKYASKKALSEAVERYFRGISRTETLHDDAGRVVCSDDGEPYTFRRYLEPPTITGLCLALGIERSTWQNYADPKLHPEFREITEAARARIEAYLERELLTREKSVQGIIFNLQNNYGWRQKQEVELGDKTRSTVRTESMSLQDKLALIAQAAASMAAEEVPPDENGENDNRS